MAEATKYKFGCAAFEHSRVLNFVLETHESWAIEVDSSGECHI